MLFIFKLYFLLISKLFIPQNGDLLFQDIDCGPLCEAIEQVTTGIHGANISHLGLVVEKNDSIFVLEAISEGVVMTPLNDFLNRSLDSMGNPKVIATRLKPEYKHLIPDVIHEAAKFLGKPYDDAFIPNNDSYYCSELIYLSFKAANYNTEFFHLEPMTFKSFGTNTFLPVWVEYYKELGLEIPEGVPGINPGAISRSDKIEIVHIYGKLESLVN